jgi:hypothetical protein
MPKLRKHEQRRIAINDARQYLRQTGGDPNTANADTALLALDDLCRVEPDGPAATWYREAQEATRTRQLDLFKEEWQQIQPPRKATKPQEPQPAGSYQQQYVKCNKPNCQVCKTGPGHGPYWYLFWREGKKIRKRYIGKELPKSDQDQDQTPERSNPDIDQFFNECGI